MSNKKYILAIDQGTSSTKSLIFDEGGQALVKGYAPLKTNFLDNAFVEQDPEDIYRCVLASVEDCLNQFYSKGFHEEDIAAIGISNQRETFVVWDKEGKPLHDAIVWQCKRSVGICEQLKNNGLSNEVNAKTGLVIDPYFSATKLIWLFQNNPAVTTAIQNGEAYFGTIDTWLLYKLTNGAAYATDYTNASRTMFFNLHSLSWDNELIDAYELTGLQLPEIKSSSAFFGETKLGGIFKNSIPVTGLIGDSHAAAVGEGCFEPGTAKATLGTGCSILMNIGSKPLPSQNGMVTTVCWSAGDRIDFAYEGVIVSCGATIEWLKNSLNLFADSKDTEAMATAVADNGGLYLIPAFSGLGSPHWQMDRRASISGMSFGSTKNHIVRAALESIPYQVMDVIKAMEKDAGISLQQLNVNGGIGANNFVVQFLADVLNRNVATSSMPDVSALGAALMAGLHCGVYKNLEALKHINTNKKIRSPSGRQNEVATNYSEWQARILQQ